MKARAWRLSRQTLSLRENRERKAARKGCGAVSIMGNLPPAVLGGQAGLGLGPAQLGGEQSPQACAHPPPLLQTARSSSQQGDAAGDVPSRARVCPLQNLPGEDSVCVCSLGSQGRLEGLFLHVLTPGPAQLPKG